MLDIKYLLFISHIIYYNQFILVIYDYLLMIWYLFYIDTKCNFMVCTACFVEKKNLLYFNFKYKANH